MDIHGLMTLLSPFQFSSRGRPLQWDPLLVLGHETISLHNEAGEDIANGIRRSTKAKPIIDEDDTPLGIDHVAIQIANTTRKRYPPQPTDV